MRRLNRAAYSRDRCLRRRKGSVNANAVATVLHAVGRDVKPVDTTGYRTSSADCAQLARNTHNIPDDDGEFFLVRPPCDSPRPHKMLLVRCQARRLSSIVFRVAADTVGGDVPYHARIVGSDSSLAIGSTDVPPECRPHCNTGPTDAGSGTKPHSPSTDIDDGVAKPHRLVLDDNSNKLKLGPREGCSPTVKSRRQASTSLRDVSFSSSSMQR